MLKMACVWHSQGAGCVSLRFEVWAPNLGLVGWELKYGPSFGA